MQWRKIFQLKALECIFVSLFAIIYFSLLRYSSKWEAWKCNRINVFHPANGRTTTTDSDIIFPYYFFSTIFSLFFYLALARLSPRFQWFISIYSLFFLASPLFVRLSKKWYFRKHLAQYCFSRALCTILQQEAASATSGWRGGRLRPEWACVSNTKWWEKSISSIFCLFHTLFWTHNCTFLRCRGRHTQLHDRRKKNQEYGIKRVFAYSARAVSALVYGALQKLLSSSLRPTIRSRSVLASLHSILFSNHFFFTPAHSLHHSDHLAPRCHPLSSWSVFITFAFNFKCYCKIQY